MIETLEKKIYESVNKNGLFGLGLIPITLILDTKKFIKVENIKDISDIIGCYIWSGLIELVKEGVYSLTGYTLYKGLQNLI